MKSSQALAKTTGASELTIMFLRPSSCDWTSSSSFMMRLTAASASPFACGVAGFT